MKPGCLAAFRHHEPEGGGVACQAKTGPTTQRLGSSLEPRWASENLTPFPIDSRPDIALIDKAAFTLLPVARCTSTTVAHLRPLLRMGDFEPQQLPKSIHRPIVPCNLGLTFNIELRQPGVCGL